MKKLLSIVLCTFLSINILAQHIFAYADNEDVSVLPFEESSLDSGLTEETSFIPQNPSPQIPDFKDLYNADRDHLFTYDDGKVALFHDVTETEDDSRRTAIEKISRDYLAHFLKFVGQMIINLEGKGSKVNHIKILQDDKTLIETYNVLSYSREGMYYLLNFRILHPFKNPSGKNDVTVYFYYDDKLVDQYPYTFHITKEKRVLRFFTNIKLDPDYASNSFSLEEADTVYFNMDATEALLQAEILNAKEEDKIDISIVTITDGLMVPIAPQTIATCSEMEQFAGTYSGSLIVRAKLKYLLPPREMNALPSYVKILVNGEPIPTKQFILEFNRLFRITSYPRYDKLPDSIKLGIINGNQISGYTTPIKINFYQGKDGLTGTTKEYSIKWDEKDSIQYMDIPLKREFFARPGEEFRLSILSEEASSAFFSQTFLTPKDSLEKDSFLVEDGLDPEAKLIPMKYNQPIDKIFKVRFNAPVDIDSINNTNAYIIDKKTKEHLQIDLDRLQIDSLDGNKTQKNEITIATKQNYRPNQLYILVLEPSIRGTDGRSLKKQVIMYFTTDYK